MARTNRNNQYSSNTTSTKKLYQVSIYARLSIEDNGIQSESIDNQIDMMKRYISKFDDMKLVSIWIDNGYSGTNFERPGFTAMLDEIKSGKINCIIVKDLSRFGRNYTEAGNYLETIFPCLNIRFISINDDYDSIRVDANTMLTVALKNICHYMYAKDISNKVCTSIQTKKKNGLFLARFAPYGYKKSNNRHKLEIDPETAPIVQKIFQWKLEGIGESAIARRLNDMDIPCQYKRLYMQGMLKGSNGENHSIWSGGSVISILQNPNYYGCIVERKSEAAYYKGGGKRILPQQEWNYIEGTHEGIISKVDFDKVQCLIRTNKNNKKETKNCKKPKSIFAGLLICGYCGKKIQKSEEYINKNGELISYFRCPQKYKKKDACQSGSMKESDLCDIVFHTIKTHISVLYETKAEMEECVYVQQVHTQKRGLSKKEAELKNMEEDIIKSYNDYKQERIQKEAYLYIQNQYEERKNNLKQEIRKMNSQSNLPALLNLNLEKYQSDFLTAELCRAMIKKIIITKEQIKIHFTFKDELEQAIQFLDVEQKGGEICEG